jgi:hypothetical protein
MVTCPTVKKLNKVPETWHQNCLLIIRYHFCFRLKWHSGHLLVPVVRLPVPLGMWNNSGKHCSVVNGSTVGNSTYVREHAPALWLDRMTIMLMRMDKLFSTFWWNSTKWCQQRRSRWRPFGSSNTLLPVNEDVHAYSWFLSILRSGSFGTSETVAKKKTEILRDDSTHNWQPFETVRQNKVFWHPKPQFEVGKRSKLVGLFLSLIYLIDIII